MIIAKVLGGGCKSCHILAQRVEEAAEEMGVEVEVQKVTDINDIMAYDVLMTPGLVLDEKLVVSGKVPQVKEIAEFLEKAQG